MVVTAYVAASDCDRGECLHTNLHEKKKVKKKEMKKQLKGELHYWTRCYSILICGVVFRCTNKGPKHAYGVILR